MTFIESLVTTAIVLILATPFVVSNIGATSGTHTGIITAVETNSFIFSTQRAYVKTSAESTQEDTYCVQDLEVYAGLQELAQSGETATVEFSHPLVEWLWNCGGDVAIITGIKK